MNTVEKAIEDVMMRAAYDPVEPVIQRAKRFILNQFMDDLGAVSSKIHISQRKNGDIDVKCGFAVYNIPADLTYRIRATYKDFKLDCIFQEVTA